MLARFACLLSLAACAATLALAGLATASPAHTTRELVAPLRAQIDAGRVKAATIYTSRHVIHASLAGGRRYSVRFRPPERRTLVARLLAHHVRFHILKGTVHGHGLRRRYIVLIVLAALAALGGVAVFSARRRGRGGPSGGAAPA